MKRLSVFLTLVTVFVAQLTAQPSERRISRKEYIDTYKEEAVKEMLRTGIPASITMAQAILESGDGNSPLARYANNHFGIKCHRGWEGPTFVQDDDARNECFRKYYSVYESYKDHSEFLVHRSRYQDLFTLKPTDYKGWARGLKKAGYATNPKYADLLIRIIEDNDLHQFDKVKRMPEIKREPSPEPENPEKLKQRTVQVHDNNIEYVIARGEDSFYKIAKEFDMRLWQILKYNDLNKGDPLKAGDIIYLQPKRNRAKVKHHIVKEGETMRDISQKYGIKLKKLYRKNRMIAGTEPRVGQKLNLRRRKRK